MRADRFIEKYKWPIIAVSVLITLFFALWLPRLDIDPNIDAMIPEHLDARANTDRINELFGSSDMMVVLYRADDILNPATLTRIEKTVNRIRQVKGVDRTNSLFDAKDIRGDDGAMIVSPAVEQIPKDTEGLESLRKRLTGNEMVYGKVLSPDYRMTAIFISLNKNTENNVLVPEIKKLVNNEPGNEEVFFGGMPVLKASIAGEISRDMSILMPAALGLMIVMLLLAFRQVKGVVLPFAVVAMSIIVTMGLMPLLGWKVTIIAILLPVMLIAIANDYGIHLIAMYQELNAEGKILNRSKLVRTIVKRLSRPVLLTGLTTVAGVLGLLSHILVPARQLGILAAVGIAFALMMSLFFIPAILLLLKVPPKTRAKGKGGKHVLEVFLARMGRGIVRHPRRVLAVTAVVILIAAGGLFLVRVDANIENFFPKNHPVRKSADLLNQHFGGAEDLSIWFTGDIKDPRLLHRMEKYGNALKKDPHIGNVVSITDAIHEMSKALNDPGDPHYDRIPDSRDAIAQYFVLYSMSGDPGDFEQLVDFDYRNAQMLVRINDGSTNVINGVVDKINNMVKNDPAFSGIGGYGYINARLSQLIITGQMRSLLAAILVVSILVMLIFRSVPSGLFVSVPLVAAVIILFGLMGYAGISLDVATAMLSSIMIGVGVDYTIHYIWRYREERRAGYESGDAVYRALTTTGRGIVFNALSVIVGFSALLISSFTPIRFFGFLVVVSITACLIGALVVIPALILVIKPGFLEPLRKEKPEAKERSIPVHVKKAM